MTLDVHHLVKRFGRAFVLSVPELRLETGQTLGLVGNNGAGKTTFLRLVLDLLRPDEGCVTLDGARVDETTDWKKKTGSYLDAGFLIDFLTPTEFLRFVGSTYGLAEDAVDARIAAARPFFTDAIFGPSERYLRDLSTGNAKKVGVLAALMSRPNLLILDEPFANLDPRSQIQLKNMLRRANEVDGTTLIVSSHDLVHVTEVCRRIAVLDAGEVVRDEATTEATLDTLEAFFSGEGRPPSDSTQPPGNGEDA